MKVAIIGYGIEGQSSERYWRTKGAEVEIRDVRSGPDYLDGLDKFDLIVRTPSLRPDELTSRGIDPFKITSNVKEMLHASPAPIIGVTGTKGKGTTSTLIAQILAASGRRVWLGGNIGRPPLDFLPQVASDDWVVLELSSFQLFDVTRSPQISVCLMIAPEHLNWHRDLREYIEAKGNIFRHQRADDLAVHKGSDPEAKRLAETSAGRHLPYGLEPGAVVQDGSIVIDGVQIISVDEVALPGPHNLENVCAAVTATWELVGRDPEPLKRAIGAFSGLPHHLELVGEVDGVRYYDDSFSTTPESAIAAIASFAAPKVLILGGSDKGVTYGELAKAVATGNVSQVFLIGDMAPVIAAELRAVGYDRFHEVVWKDMPALVELTRRASVAGSVVLLSPGCASFGLFEDYKQRGEQFATAVGELK